MSSVSLYEAPSASICVMNPGAWMLNSVVSLSWTGLVL